MLLCSSQVPSVPNWTGPLLRHDGFPQSSFMSTLSSDSSFITSQTWPRPHLGRTSDLLTREPRYQHDTLRLQPARTASSTTIKVRISLVLSSLCILSLPRPHFSLTSFSSRRSAGQSSSPSFFYLHHYRRTPFPHDAFFHLRFGVDHPNFPHNHECWTILPPPRRPRRGGPLHHYIHNHARTIHTQPQPVQHQRARTLNRQRRSSWSRQWERQK